MGVETWTKSARSALSLDQKNVIGLAAEVRGPKAPERRLPWTNQWSSVSNEGPPRGPSNFRLLPESEGAKRLSFRSLGPQAHQPDTGKG